MIRVLPIILAICVAIVSGLIALVGVRALAFYEQATAAPIAISCNEILQTVPEETYHFALTDWSCGENIYPNFSPSELDDSDDSDDSDDEIEPLQQRKWDSVFVCFFPKGKRLHDNYAAVILHIHDVHSLPELKAYLDSESLEFHYWPNRQTIDTKLYSRMANKYRRMNFDSCVLGDVGGQLPNADFGRSCIRIGIGGIAVAAIGVVILFLWKILRYLTAKKHDPWYDDPEKEDVSNRANLPAV